MTLILDEATQRRLRLRWAIRNDTITATAAAISRKEAGGGPARWRRYHELIREIATNYPVAVAPGDAVAGDD